MQLPHDIVYLLFAEKKVHNFMWLLLCGGMVHSQDKKSEKSLSFDGTGIS